MAQRRLSRGVIIQLKALMKQFKAEEVSVNRNLKVFRKRGAGLSADRIIREALDSFARSNDTVDYGEFMDDREKELSTVEEEIEEIG